MPEKEGRKPDLDLQNEVFVKEVRRLTCGVKWTEEKPTVKDSITNKDGAGTFYTFTLDGKTIVAEWRAKSGFGISNSRQTVYGEDPSQIIMNPYLAAKKVAQLLGADEIVGHIG